MNPYTEAEEVITEAQTILFASHSVPRVLLNIIIDYVRWDWPCPGEIVAAMDTAGKWYQARVRQRTCDKAFVHYNGWHEQKWDEWINRGRDHLAVKTYNNGQDNSDVLFPRLRTVAAMEMIGTWQPDLRPTPYSPCPRSEVKMVWSPS